MTYRIHALLVHFPISAWTCASAIELIPPLQDSLNELAIPAALVATLLIWTGIFCALPSALAGGHELLQLPEGSPIETTAKNHALAVAAVFLVFLLCGLTRTDAMSAYWPVGVSKGLMLLGLVLLTIAGHLGNRVVTERRRNTVESETRTAN